MAHQFLIISLRVFLMLLYQCYFCNKHYHLILFKSKQICTIIIAMTISTKGTITIEHKKDYNIWCWKSNSWLETGTKMRKG